MKTAHRIICKHTWNKKIFLVTTYRLFLFIECLIKTIFFQQYSHSIQLKKKKPNYQYLFKLRYCITYYECIDCSNENYNNDKLFFMS